MPEVLGKYMVDYAPRKIPHRLGPFDDAGIPLFDLGRIRICLNLCIIQLLSFSMH